MFFVAGDHLHNGTLDAVGLLDAAGWPDFVAGYNSGHKSHAQTWFAMD